MINLQDCQVQVLCWPTGSGTKTFIPCDTQGLWSAAYTAPSASLSSIYTNVPSSATYPQTATAPYGAQWTGSYTSSLNYMLPTNTAQTSSNSVSSGNLGGQSVGYTNVKILVAVGSSADNTIATLKLQECDTIGGTYTDVTGGDFSSTLTYASQGVNLTGQVTTASNTVWIWDIAMQNRKRFLKVSFAETASSTGSVVAAFAVLGGAQQGLNNASDWGATGYLFVA